MKNIEQIEAEIKETLGDTYKINVSNSDAWSKTLIKISIRWDYIGFYEGNSMYSENEFVYLNKQTLKIESVSNSTLTVVKKVLAICNS